MRQIGPRARRSRTAAASKAAASAKPSHRLALLRNTRGVRCVIGSIGSFRKQFEGFLEALPFTVSPLLVQPAYWSVDPPGAVRAIGASVVGAPARRLRSSRACTLPGRSRKL